MKIVNKINDNVVVLNYNKEIAMKKMKIEEDTKSLYGPSLIYEEIKSIQLTPDHIKKKIADLYERCIKLENKVKKLKKLIY